MAGDREVKGRLKGSRKPVYRDGSSFGAHSPSLMKPVDQRTIRRMKGEWSAAGAPPVGRGVACGRRRLAQRARARTLDDVDGVAKGLFSILTGEAPGSVNVQIAIVP